MVDIIGFNHISGERLLGLDGKNDMASAYRDVTIPETGAYRLWVRYEYPAFCETRFRVVVQQDGRTALNHVMGTKNSPRFGFGEPLAKAQHDPAWGSEGLFEEVVTVQELKAGKARIYLKGVAQPQTPGVTAHRNIDLVYLTRDTRRCAGEDTTLGTRSCIRSWMPSAIAEDHATKCVSPIAATNPPISTSRTSTTASRGA